MRTSFLLNQRKHQAASFSIIEMDDLDGYNSLTRALETKTFAEFAAVVAKETKARINRRNADSTTVLMVAAALDDENAVRLLLKMGAKSDKTTKDELGWTALMIAARSGSVRSAQALLEHDASDVNAASKTGRTAVSLAVGNERMLRLLLDKGAGVNTSDCKGISPLMRAVRKRCIGSARMLMEAGAEVNASENREGLTPLLMLLMAGKEDLKMLSALLEKGADVNAEMHNRVWSALSLAVHLNLLSTARAMINYGADVDHLGAFAISPLMRAVLDGHYDMTKMLLREKASLRRVDSRGYSVLMRAVQRGDVNIVRLLLNSGADANEKMSANRLKRTKQMVELPFDADHVFQFDPCNEGVTPLMVAARTGKLEMVQLLLSHKANPHSKAFRGDTALTVATLYQHRKVVKLLLKSAPDVNDQNSAGLSPLMLATLTNNLTLTRLLVKQGSDLFLQDRLGNSAMTFAALSGGARLVQFLLRRDPDVVDLRSFDGRSPLFSAVAGNRPNVVRMLLEEGASVNAREVGSKKTALDFAIMLKRTEVARLLIEFGGLRGRQRRQDNCCCLM